MNSQLPERAHDQQRVILRPPDLDDDQIVAAHEATMETTMADPEQAAAYRVELEEWDGTLLDGLE